MSESRDITFDIIKGFGVILIIAGHTLGYENAAYPFIYVFHVPLFFLVSGFFYKHQELRKQLKKDLAESKRLCKEMNKRSAKIEAEVRAKAMAEKAAKKK